MGDPLACPRTGEICTNQTLCSEANIPLQNVIPHIRREVGGIAWGAAKFRLEREIKTQGDILRGVNLRPSFDREGNATVCPGEILDDGLVERVGQDSAAATLRSLSQRCVSNAINYLNHQRGNC